MPKLADRMAEALSSAAAAAKDQGLASDLHSPSAQEPPAPVEEQPPAPTRKARTASEPPAEVAAAPTLAFLERSRSQPVGDLVQFGFRCPRDLKREVERFCFEHEVTLQEFGQEALRLLLEECRKRV